MLLLIFVCLQVLDGATTLWFLSQGISEANPMIHALLDIFRRPEFALALPKLFGIALAVFAWYSGRHRLLRNINLVFAICVTWNVVAIVCHHS